MGAVGGHAAIIVAGVLQPLLASAALLLTAAPAAAAADSPATYLSGRTFACVQMVAVPGTGDRYRPTRRGRVSFATDYVPMYLRGGRQGSFAPTATGVRFTGGPLSGPGRRSVGDVHPDGVAMPHDRGRGTRYQLVLRGTGTVTPWFCRATT